VCDTRGYPANSTKPPASTLPESYVQDVSFSFGGFNRSKQLDHEIGVWNGDKGTYDPRQLRSPWSGTRNAISDPGR